MTRSIHSVAALRPLVEECGYSKTRLGIDFRVGDDVFPLVGFASKPWDFDSACIAVTAAPDNPEEAVKKMPPVGCARSVGMPEWGSGMVDAAKHDSNVV